MVSNNRDNIKALLRRASIISPDLENKLYFEGCKTGIPLTSAYKEINGYLVFEFRKWDEALDCNVGFNIYYDKKESRIYR